MPEATDTSLIRRKYQDAFGACIAPSFGSYISRGPEGRPGAMLGYRRADEGGLFLEAYLDLPIEQHVGEAFGRSVARDQIVEIGNFAADNALAMIDLWGAAANDLATGTEIAVATLTAQLRRVFARIGIPVVELAPANALKLGAACAPWGRYYESDPRVCAGVIVDGQSAIAAFLGRRLSRAAA
ncbi:MAG: hypothetical protein H6R45_913 [Proteobacteria bacterium]|nr:hypothetical protein [Pseudomonadota bacterium]